VEVEKRNIESKSLLLIAFQIHGMKLLCLPHEDVLIILIVLVNHHVCCTLVRARRRGDPSRSKGIDFGVFVL